MALYTFPKLHVTVYVCNEIFLSFCIILCICTCMHGCNIRWMYRTSSYNPNITVISAENYRLVLYALGGAHNTFSVLVLITYFLSNHPSPPSLTAMIEDIKYVTYHKCDIHATVWHLCDILPIATFRDYFKKDPNKEKDDDDDEEESKLQIKLISVTTFYYLVKLSTLLLCSSIQIRL